MNDADGASTFLWVVSIARGSRNATLTRSLACGALTWLLLQTVFHGTVAAATLEVGPGKPFRQIEDANAQARAGDVILVHPQAGGRPYERVAILVRQKDLAFRAATTVGSRRLKISGSGFEYSGDGSTPRAIFQFDRGADGCSLEGFDLSGAHNKSHNAAGVRTNQANRITIRDCAIHSNDMGIMSNGDGTADRAVDQRIENCEVYRNGDPADPGFNHNLYLGGTSVTVRGCEIHSSLTGHDLKSRAHFTRVEYCYLHGAANRELDLVDSADTARPNSHAVILGCIVVKDPHCQGNRSVIHFGQDGGKPHNGTLSLLFNTIVTPFVAPVVELSSPQAGAYLLGNLVSDGGNRQAGQHLVGIRAGAARQSVRGMHNWFSGNFGSAAVRRSTRKPTSSAAQSSSCSWTRQGTIIVSPGKPPHPAQHRCALRISDAPGLADEPRPRGESPLAWQYRHPASQEKRPAENGMALGAYGR